MTLSKTLKLEHSYAIQQFTKIEHSYAIQKFTKLLTAKEKKISCNHKKEK